MMKIDPMFSMAGMMDQAKQAKQVVSQSEGESFSAMLEKAKKSQDDTQLMAACQQFESYFLNQMLKGMRATVPKTDLVEKSFGREVFEEMLDEQYSEEMAKAGGIGLAQMLYEDLNRRK